MTSVFEVLEERRVERENSVHDSYQTLVREVAAGREFEIMAAESILTAVGKSAYDLRADVDKLHRIAALREQLSHEDELRDTLRKAEADVEAANERLRVESLRLHEERQAAMAVEREARQRVNELGAVRSELEKLTEPSAEELELASEIRTLSQQSVLHTAVPGRADAFRAEIKQLTDRREVLRLARLAG